MNYFKLLGLLLFMCLCLTACASPEQKAEAKRLESNAEKNAKEYIKEKYNFKAKVINTEYERLDGGPFPSYSPTGNVFVEMSDSSDKSFIVYISGEDDLLDSMTESEEDSGELMAFDNYQMDDIINAFESEISHLLDNNDFIMNLSYGKFDSVDLDDKNYGLVNSYFDGSIESLYNLTSNHIFKTFVSLVDYDGLSDLTLSDLTLLGEDGKALFVNYKSEELLKMSETSCYNLLGHPIGIGLTDDAILIEDYVSFDGEELNYDKFEILTYQEENGNSFYYMIDSEKGTYCDFISDKLDDASNWNGSGFRNAENIYNSYSIDTDISKLDIWLPVESLEFNDGEHPRFVVQYYKNGDMRYVSTTTDTIGDRYIHATIYPTQCGDDLKFGIFIDRPVEKEV